MSYQKLIAHLEVDRAHENLQKSGKGYGMSGRRKYLNSKATSNVARDRQASTGSSQGVFLGGRSQHLPGSRPHSVNSFDDSRVPPGPNLHNFYAAQRHQPSRGSNDAEQVIQAKRRMAAQRERELRNLHTEQQYQRSKCYHTIFENPMGNRGNMTCNHNCKGPQLTNPRCSF